MIGRTIAIGDIHGCHEEFEALLARLNITNEDTLILLGDLVNRGPSSRRTLDIAKKLDVICLLGNHEYDTVFVHGGFVPDKPWESQNADTVTRIQVIDDFGKPAKRAACPDGEPWAHRWQGPPFVVYGHTPRPDIYNLEWSVGIDTACVMGGHLTAYILPDRRFVQVRAKQRYYR